SVAFNAWFLRSCERNPAGRWPDPLTQWTELARALGVSGPRLTPAWGIFGTPSPEAGTALPAGQEGLATEATTPSRPGLREGPTRQPHGTATRQQRQVTVLFYRLVHADCPTGDPGPEEFEALQVRLRRTLDDALGDLGQTSGCLTPAGRF